MEDTGALVADPTTWLTMVTVAPFCIDRTEVTRSQYRECVRIGPCRVPPRDRFRWPGRGLMLDCDGDLGDDSKRENPVVCVNFDEATAYCHWRGGRLPMDTEWYQAARGVAGFVPERMNDLYPAGLSLGGAFGESSETLPVGTHPDDISAYGVLDMLASVSEWTDSDSYVFAKSPVVVRQAGWFVFRGDLAGQSRGVRLYTKPSPGTGPQERLPNLGFRCVHATEPGEILLRPQREESQTCTGDEC